MLVACRGVQDPAETSGATTPSVAPYATELRWGPLDWSPLPDVTIQGRGYGGSVPGPLIRVPVGSPVRVDFVNDNPVGWEDSIHWHGIEGNNAADGTGVTQAHVHPGGRFTYEFTVTRPGLHWYHPHRRGAQGIWDGSYGPLWVEDAAEAELTERGVLPADTRVLVLGDISDFQGAPFSVEIDDAMVVMNGTEGKHLLVNGLVDPEFEVVAGSAVRLLVLNASIARHWRLSVPGHTLYRVGGQGGLLDAVRVEGGTVPARVASSIDGTDLGPVDFDLGYPKGQIVLAPAERADLVLVPQGAPGDVVALRWEDVVRGRHGMWMEGDVMVMGDAEDDGLRPGEDVATFRLVEGEATPWTLGEGDPVLGAVGRTVGRASLEGAVVRHGDDAMVLSERMDMTLEATGLWSMSTELFLDGAAWLPDFHDGPASPLAPTSFSVRVGDTLDWEFRNDSDMSHPLHVHGFSFQPRSWQIEDEEAGTTTSWDVPWDEWVDTVRMPPHSTLFVAMPIADPVGGGRAAGRWMRHCHIVQHAEAGMMSEFVVDP